MRLQVTVVDSVGRPSHMVVDAEPETPVREVLDSIAAPAEEFTLDGERLDWRVALNESRLRDGAVLVATVPGRHPTIGGDRPVHPGWELAVVGGPSAGTVRPLELSSVVVGRSPDSDLAIDDPAVSRHHARLTAAVQADGSVGWMVEDLGSSHGTWVSGKPCTGPTPVIPGTPVEVGASVLEIRLRPPGDADVHTENCSRAFNRPARIHPASTAVRVELPDEPTLPESVPLPWIQALAPLVVAGLLYLFLRTTTVLLFAVLGPVMFISGTVGGRRRDKKRRTVMEAGYQAGMEQARRRIEMAVGELENDGRLQAPDPAYVAAVAAGPNRRLWERRDYDDDFLVMRLGLATRPASLEIVPGRPASKRPGAPSVTVSDPVEIPKIQAAPVSVDLPGVGVIGIAGPTASARAAGRWLVNQAATWHSPTAVRICLLTEPGSEAEWGWSRWLPHLRPLDPSGPLAWVGTDPDSCQDRIRELLELVETRSGGADRSGGRDVPTTPAVVLVLDGARALRSLPGVPRLLRDGPAKGIYVVALDTASARLPEEGGAELTFDPGQGTTATLRVRGSDPVDAILVDQVGVGWSEAVSRSLSAVRDAGGAQAGSVLPASVRLVDLIGLDLDRPQDVAERWRTGGSVTSVPVGVCIDGIFELDLRRDGPHGLVAGTTGSGKSEFLQSLVASLALANRPDALNFVLVDYKGGAAFADCAELPHTVGLVTNLDGRETRRALASLEAELRRRETCLRDLRSADVDEAWTAHPDQARHAGLARLVLVIDEFAELVHELPDFVTGLIRIARVGRSLGVHLLLATQRPAGVVSGEMRANTGLRVALRMEDPGDSQEVLETADAARIARNLPGRAFARLGGGAAVVAFQSARVAGRRKGVTTGLPKPVAREIPWSRIGHPLINRSTGSDDTGVETDLHAIVELLRGAHDLSEIEAPRSPWLAPLPVSVTLDALDPEGEAQAHGPVPFGIEDRPAEQSQPVARFDLQRGHLAIVGAARSGRSTALRTLAASLVRHYPPDDLHIYALDFGNGAMSSLSDLPHCGAVVRRSETDRIERLVAKLVEELDRRQEELARLRVGDIEEQRAQCSSAADRMAYEVLLIDRWEGLSTSHSLDSGSPLIGLLGRLIREGTAVGFRVVIGGDRSLLTDRLTAAIEDRLVLRMPDPDDYRLAGLNPRSIDSDMPPGRALWAENGREVQMALVSDDPSAASQAESIKALAGRLATRWGVPVVSPLRVGVLPTALSLAEVAPLLDTVTATPMPLSAAPGPWVAIGLGGDEAAPCGVDLGVLGGFVVAGPPRSGRTTALTTMATWLAQTGVRTLVVAPRPSSLRDAAGRLGLTVLEDVSARSGAEAVEIITDSPGPLVVLVDDADMVARSELDEAVRMAMRGGERSRMLPVVAGPVEDLRNELRGLVGEARRSKAGLLLSATGQFDGDLFGVRIPKLFLERLPAGRSCLVVDGVCHLVQVASPE